VIVTVPSSIELIWNVENVVAVEFFGLVRYLVVERKMAELPEEYEYGPAPPAPLNEKNPPCAESSTVVILKGPVCVLRSAMAILQTR
jgi:hypothetical protein